MRTIKSYTLAFVVGCSVMPVLAEAAIALKSNSSDQCTSSSGIIHRQKRFFKPTVFHTPVVQAGGTCRLVDSNFKTLTMISCDLKKHCDMQGVCFLNQGNKIIGYNFIKKRKGISIYAKVDASRCPYGYGVWDKEHNRSICMDPFRSLAADNKYHKPGSVLYFPALKGLKLPDASIHDGYMTVRSAGGAIKGRDRFDFYTGLCQNPGLKSMLCKTESLVTQLVSSGFGTKQKLAHKDRCFYAYYKVPSSLKNIVLTKRNYPDLPELEVITSQLKMGHFYGPIESKNRYLSFDMNIFSIFSSQKQILTEEQTEIAKIN